MDTLGGHPGERTGVLFVCLGNICRSPLAEGIFLHQAAARGVKGLFEVDSCGTGAWHVGEEADPRSIAVAKRYGVELPSIARQLNARSDFTRFHLLVPMDGQNEEHLLRAGAARERVRLMRSFDPRFAKAARAPDVPDPYSGGPEGFERVYEMLWAACEGMLEELVSRRRP